VENIIYSVNFRFRSTSFNEAVSSLIFRILRFCAFTVGAILLGFLGLVLLFPTGSPVTEIIVLMLFPIVTGAILGFVSPKTWAMSALVAWGGLIFLVIEPDKKMGLAVLAGYAVLALIGGIAGRNVRLKKRIL
jgi:hypothetical protein